MNNQEDSCPICGNKSYLNPNMKLLMSICYHIMCDSCVERVFYHGTAPCPICNTILRKSNFMEQKFEDLNIEKECNIRKMMWNIFNKTEDEFNNIKEYNDYLEMIEDYVEVLLINEKDPDILGKIDRYKRENKEKIRKNAIVQMNYDKKINEYVYEKKKKKEQEEENTKILLNSLKKNYEEGSKKIVEEIEKTDKPASLIIAEKIPYSTTASISTTSNISSTNLILKENLNREVKRNNTLLDVFGKTHSPTLDKPPYLMNMKKIVDTRFNDWLNEDSSHRAGGLCIDEIFLFHLRLISPTAWS